MDQSEKTKKFIEACEALISAGEVKNYAEIIDRLDWEKSMFSNVKNGRKNVPNYIFKKFTEVFHPIEGNGSNETINVSRDVTEFVGERVELTAAMRAAIKILTLRNIEMEVRLSELEVKEGKGPIQSFSTVSLKIERMMQDETERILDEWRKK